MIRFFQKNYINYKKQYKFRASILIIVIVFTSVFIVLGNVAVQYLVNQLKQTHLKIDKELAFQISEAGIDYYRWHLSHVPGDYQDGTGQVGPYVHDYRDSQGNITGQYKLEITPPEVGSTIVTIKSTGYLIEKPDINKTITLKLGIPSFTQYAVLSNSDIRLGPTMEISGLVHSNGGVRFDGIAHNLVTSSKEEYNDPDHGELGNPEDGVHTHCSDSILPEPGCTCPSEDPGCDYGRTDKEVFLGGKEFPVAPVDFGGLSFNLTETKSKASSENGIYLTHSGKQGYHVVFNHDHKKVSIYKVNSQKICKYRKTDYFVNYENMYSVDKEEEFIYKENSSLDMDIPENGLIFIEDNVWVDGRIDGSRVTVIAAKEPFSTGDANIIINNNLLYTNKDGQDAIGLIAQNDILIGFYSENNLEIDAALIAENGKVSRYYYEEGTGYKPAECGDYIFRDNLTIYGSLATNQRFGFAYTDGDKIISGYKDRKIDFDSNLHLSPPPSFPTVGDYEIISWTVN